MAGIAALLTLDPTVTRSPESLAEALAPRGPDVATRDIGATTVLVRAAIPTIHGTDTAAMVIDGIAEASTLAQRYANLGAAGLVAGGDPYALVYATGAMLVLARNGDGPPLYYAVTPTHAVAASEPRALLAAGVPAEPDAAVVARFLATGACDDTEDTFFAGVRRVLPGQVVEITRKPLAVRTHLTTPARTARVSAQMALQWATLSGRVGVRLGGGVAGAAVLGAALARVDGPQALAVYSATFPGLPAAPAEYASALIGPLPLGAVRHRALPFFADEIDLDALLVDVGEPVPDLTAYLLWATARATAGEVDALVDASPARPHLSRLADRVASRFGVTLRFPFQDVTSGGEILRAELVAAAERMLPAAASRYALTADAPTEPPLRDLLGRMRAELLTTFLHRGDRRCLAAFEALVAGRRVDAPALFRRYVVERWLRCVVEPVRDTPVRRAVPAAVIAGGATWERHPVQTEVLGPGDKLPEKLAWYVAENLPEGRRPWYVLVAARPVAVVQGRARFAWDVRPGLFARVVARLAGPATGLSTPWAAQVAAEVGGRPRLAVAAACAILRKPAWYARFAGVAVRSVSGPREDAVSPGNVAVVPPPADPDRVAAEVVAALRTALPVEVYTALAGCAVVSVSDVDCRVLGWAPHAAVAPPEPREFLAELCRGNPFGQGGERTPVVVAVRAPRTTAARPGKRGKGGGRRR